ncbi:DUF6115 domain-containing protein [Aquibacillus saliphilus]|uniref:DUF6115 domain-containing protein n=1 Tax=Aquibacillus saliphilus TaxID=1909422 RepID=UPI001CF08FDC|nr:coupling factor for flagellin transcription and translation [Aquibacillus saliphilus]
MIYFLLLISFLLHITFFIVLKNYKMRLNDYLESESEKRQHVKEVEDLLAVYLLEIKDENDKLLSAINHSDEVKSEDNEPIKTTEVVNKKNNTNKQTNSKLYQAEVRNEPAEYTPPSVDDVQDTVEQSITGKVYTLYDQGESVESIARKLDCGKTEIELMLKFHRKNS